MDSWWGTPGSNFPDKKKSFPSSRQNTLFSPKRGTNRANTVGTRQVGNRPGEMEGRRGEAYANRRHTSLWREAANQLLPKWGSGPAAGSLIFKETYKRLISICDLPTSYSSQTFCRLNSAHKCPVCKQL